MTYPNTLIFVDFPSDDPEASASFYAEVFGWEVEPRPAGVFHRIVPGQHFLLDDGEPGPIGNLHMGIFNVANARPHPDPDGVEPRALARDGRQRAHLDPRQRRRQPGPDPRYCRAVGGQRSCGGTTTGRSSTGSTPRSSDPWGNTLILWTKGGDDPQIPEGWTRE